jgi:hypothetical protein
VTEPALTRRWTPLKYHAEQRRLWRSDARFKVVSAGRRSGKTELAKRDSVVGALKETEVEGARFILAAPTLAQAKEIFWQDIQDLVPEWAKMKVSHSDLTIWLVNGDEYANCQADAWDAHIRPALSTADCIGTAWLFGVPEGRNHYYKKHQQARSCSDGEWEAFTWHSADIIPAAEVEAARASMDTMTFRQEYEGSFESFEGRAYYAFGEGNLRKLMYDPDLDLIFCFDFNVSPGTASVWQEQSIGTCCVGEVWIPQNSNTPAVCEKLAADWGTKGVGHKGRVKCYGDATGGARGTAKVSGTDWEIIEDHMRRAFPGTVSVAGRTLHRVSMNVPKKNPRERSRVNAVNTRIKAADGTRRLFVDPRKAPHVVEDLEGVRLLKGGSGEIDKKADPELTHMSDGAGYYVEREHPAKAGKTGGVKRMG